MADVTRILHAIHVGDAKAARELLPLVYGELRKLAEHRMSSESADHTLEPTALVHEAYVRLVGSDGTVLDEWVPDVPDHGFRFQVAEVARALDAGRLETWSVPWAATRRVMGVMDEVRRQVGVVYPGE